MLRSLLTAGLLAASAVPAMAQTQQSAANANNEVAGAFAARDQANADAQAQYQADLAAYDAALVRHDARADRQAERYQHQQRAYAEAMRDWRAQDGACRHGNRRACTAPAPDPANYY